MVRKIISCVRCRGRFVSVSGTSTHCQKCRRKRPVPIPSFRVDHEENAEQLDAKRAKNKLVESGLSNTTTGLDVEAIEIMPDQQAANIESTRSSNMIPLQSQKENVNQNINKTGLEPLKVNSDNSNPMDDLHQNSDAKIESSDENFNERIETDSGNSRMSCAKAVKEDDDLNFLSSENDVHVISVDDGEDDSERASVCSEAESESSDHMTLAEMAKAAAQDVNAKEQIPREEDQDDFVDDACANQEQNLTALASKNSCFICGCSFDRIKTGFRGRINHIKRCSKKHGVSGRDMRVDDDSDHFHAETESSKNPVNPLNPYTNKSDSWHGDAQQDLSLAGESVEKQTMLTSYFAAPAKSLNNVLMAGAKRLAKTGELVAAAQKQREANGKSKNKRWSYGRNYSNAPCPSYKIIPGTDFVCDGFLYARASLTQNYFLTHFHSDHYTGITKNWNAGVIYCSLPTANLVTQQLGVDKKYLHPLGMNSPVVIESRGKPVTVTLLDANHCPGAIMFLFEVNNRRRILHVGDFRWHREKMMPGLRDFFNLKYRLDDLFLDTTYCNEKYRLPTQEVAINAAVEAAEKEVAQCRRQGKRLLILFGSYTIGKERIYLAVAEKLGMKVYVDKSRYRTLSALNWPHDRMKLFTTDSSSASLWVVPLGHINFKKLVGYVSGSSTKVFAKRNFDRLIAFRPTGWSMSGCSSGQVLSSRTNGIITIHAVPYSEHSSFTELVDCLHCLKPKRIIPTVSVAKSDEQVELLLKELSKIINGSS